MNRFLRSVLCSLMLLPASLLPALAQDTRQLDWVPRGMEEFSHTATFHTDFTFDRSLLQMATGTVYGGEDDVAHAVAKLDGISVHSYRYAAPGMYDPRHLERVREQYQAAGWKHMVSAESHGMYSNTGHTDLWINFQHANVTGMVVLFSNEKNLNLIAITGNLSPLDLLHLRGHFGIPKFAGDEFVPASRAPMPAAPPDITPSEPAPDLPYPGSKPTPATPQAPAPASPYAGPQP